MTFQLAIDFPDAPRARRRDPETSHQAARQAKELAADHHRLILAALRDYGSLGKDGLASRCSLTGVQVCRRLGEMQSLGMVVLTGKTVMSTAGRTEREWRAA